MVDIYDEISSGTYRVLPFTTSDDARPILQCVNFVAKEGKLTLVSADGFRLAVVTLDYDDGEGQALISREDLRGIANALRKAKRTRVSFEGEDVAKPSSLIIDTELIRYKWASNGGQYPDWQKLIPTEFNTFASFDTVEAIKAVNSLKALSDGKAYPIDLTIGDGKIVMANPDDKGQAELVADTDGEGFTRIDGKYFANVLKACGGMVDFSFTNALSLMLFSQNGYRVVVMPMITDNAQAEAKAQAETKATVLSEPSGEVEPQSVNSQGTVETEPAKPKKAKRSRKAKETVTV